MLTAADAAAQTALLNAFTSTLKGLAPASGGGTSAFLRADGSWATINTANINNNAITNAKLATVASAIFKGRLTAGTGNVEDLTGTQATTLLDTFTTALKGLAPASGGGTVNFLRADGAWAVPPTPTSLQNLSLLGVNATADATNKLAVASSAVLFNNVGNGVQVKINKAAAADTASFLFQTSFSGRAEFGTTGDDDLHFKVSADGSAWFEALTINRTNGVVSLPQGLSALPAFTSSAKGVVPAS